jgi:hypothetical protein
MTEAYRPAGGDRRPSLSRSQEDETGGRKHRSPRVRWNVYLLGKATVRLGIVAARDRSKAIKSAIKQFDIPMRDRRRIDVTIVGIKEHELVS